MVINQLLKRMSDFYPPLQSGDLLLCAKHLFVAASHSKVPVMPGTLSGCNNCRFRASQPDLVGTGDAIITARIQPTGHYWPGCLDCGSCGDRCAKASIGSSTVAMNRVFSMV